MIIFYYFHVWNCVTHEIIWGVTLILTCWCLYKLQPNKVISVYGCVVSMSVGSIWMFLYWGKIEKGYWQTLCRIPPKREEKRMSLEGIRMKS